MLGLLLTHTSGVPDFVSTNAFVQASTAHPDDPPAPQTLLGYAPPTLDFAPGTQYAYSNSDNIVVGLMIQAVTHESYADALSTLVWKPLGLHETTLPRGAAVPPPAMHGYAITDDHPTPEDVTADFAGGWAWASGGVVSTPADLNAFIRAYVGGRLISPSLRTTWRRMLFPDSGSEPSGPGFMSAGMAVFRYQLSCGTVYGHTGNTVGYTPFAFSNAAGTRSATVSMSLQRTQHSTGQASRVFQAARRVAQAAACAALS